MGALQKVENEAMRKIFRAPDYAPIVAMRGGIGIGSMKSKVMRDRYTSILEEKDSGKQLMSSSRK